MRSLFVFLPALLFVAVLVAVVLWPTPFMYAKDYISTMGPFSYLVYVLLLTAATVFAPLTILPIIPLATTVFGPFVTSILSVIGWTAGAVIAFFIARYIGRPFIERFADLSRIDHFVSELPPHLHFWFIVILRHTVPVDILSYALGLTKSLRFSTYFWATLLGVTYFSFAFAYLGEAFFSGNKILFIELGLGSLAIFLTGWYLLHRNRN